MAALRLIRLQNVFVIILYSSHQGSFKKWCSSDIVSAISRHEIIDFTGFSGVFQDIAVTNE